MTYCSMKIFILLGVIFPCFIYSQSYAAFLGENDLSDLRDETRSSDASLGEAPHVVRVSVLGYAICAGSIVAETWILVPIKCIQPQTSILLYSVFAGDINSNITEESSQRRSVSQIVRGNRTDEDGTIIPYGILSDVALFRVYPAFNFSLHVQPIALPPSGFNLPQSTYDVYQWKFHSIPDSTEHWYTLSRIQVLSLPSSDCESMTSITETMHICAKADGDWQKNCPQEDGALLMFRTRRTQFLGGIFVFSRSRCTVENDPGAFIRISPLTQWIRGVINP